MFHPFSSQFRVMLTAFLMTGLSLAGAQAQQPLSMERAVARALENNLGIQIARQQVEMAAVGNSWGAAGALPQIGLGASASNAISDQSENPTSFIQDRLKSESVNVSGQLNWMLFDGLGMFANKRALERLVEQADGQAALVIEQTVAATMLAYNGVLVQKALSEVLLSAMDVSRARLKWMEARKANGAATTFDRLQLENALLTDSLAWWQQQANIEQATIALNRLMGESAAMDWEWLSSLEVPDAMNDFEALRARALSSATVIQNALISLSIAETGVQQAQARQSPTLSLNASQNEQTSRFEAGDLSGEGASKNLAASLALNFNLFNGGATRRAIQQAKIQVALAEMQVMEERREVERLLQDALSRWQASARAHSISAQLAANSLLALEIARERFSTGAINSLEFRDIQMQRMNSEQQQVQALYAWQAADIELRRLSGMWTIGMPVE
jgi:outer membrane protein TolC